MNFISFHGFDFMFNKFKQPLEIHLATDSNKRDEHGDPVKNAYIVRHVIEPVFVTSNPNLNYSTTNGGQQSTNSTVWESKFFKNAPRNTIVIDSDGHHFKTVSSAEIIGTDLWYYQLKEVGDEE